MIATQVTELPETTRGSGGFGSTGVARSALHEVTSVANGHKKLKVIFSLFLWPTMYIQYLAIPDSKQLAEVADHQH